MENKLSWLSEHIKGVPNHKAFYNFLKFFSFKWRKGLTYAEMFLILKDLYKSRNPNVDEKTIDLKAFQEIANIYFYNIHLNNKEKDKENE